MWKCLILKKNKILRVFHGLDSIGSIKNPVLTIGTFDGVHLGHQKIIRQLNEEAEKIGGESVLFTFDPHPRMVVDPANHGIKLIQTLEERLAKLKDYGLQNVILFPFTKQFAKLSAEEFVKGILVDHLKVKKLVIGYDHQFGNNREGNIEYLKSLSKQYGYEVIEISAQEVKADNVSSTKIREAIKNGDVEKAADYLGHPFEISGEVVDGNKLGRTIGYPTANIKVENPFKLIPANGVYAVEVKIDRDRKFGGMMNIGVRPTIQGDHRLTIEVHIFDFNEDIYEKRVSVQFLKKCRNEKKFSGIEELKDRLKKDETEIRNYLSSLH